MGKSFRIVMPIILVIALISSVAFGYLQYAENKRLNAKLDKARTDLIEVKLTLESPNIALTQILRDDSWLSNNNYFSGPKGIAPIKYQVDSAYNLVVKIKNNLD